MPEITGITNIDNTNSYNTGSLNKKQEDGSDFSTYMGQTKSMNDIFEQAADKYNVPIELLKAVGKAESDYNPYAVSKCGAQGVMQLMPATAKELGVNDSFDAEQNIMGGAKYISALLNKYNGETRLAIAAYNAGSGNVAKYGGIPPFDETQHYVKKVMNYMGEQLDATSSADSQAVPTTVRYAPTAPVQRNLSFLLTKDSGNRADSLDDLQSVFSYEDYLKFLELYTDNDNKNQDEEEKDKSYTSNKINYNVPVMNLFKDLNT